MNSYLESNEIHLEGKAQTKLTALKIPDPSIAIASVRDEVEVTFSFRLPLP